MKKIVLLGMLAVLAGCSDLSKFTTVDSNASAKTKMRACMVSEANSKFQAGTPAESADRRGMPVRQKQKYVKICKDCA